MAQILNLSSILAFNAEETQGNLLLDAKRPNHRTTSHGSTRSNTPDSKRSSNGSSYDYKVHYADLDLEDDNSSNTTNDEEHVEIDVKPKRKVFENPDDRRKFVEGYKQKLKTELCKNFELRGWCKFGDTCSFAHGKHELHQKTHLHKQYKTKPCQQFFKSGFCSYGTRCQYLHKEAMVPNIFYQSTTETSLSCERNSYSFDLLNEVWRMSNSEIRVERILNKMPERKRLQIFKDITSSKQ